MKRLLFVLLIASAFAQCDLSEMEYSSIGTYFEVVGNDARFLTVARMPMDENCLAEAGLEVLLEGPAECPADTYDAIYKGTGKMITNAECVASYDGTYLKIEGRGDIVLFVEDVSGKKEISFDKWNILEMNNTKTTLEITLPEDALDFEWAPRENSELIPNKTIHWDPIPEEAPSIIYTIQEKDWTGTVILVLSGLVGFVVLFFIIRFVGNKLKRTRDIKDEEELTIAKKKQLEYEFLKRRIDEPTFKKMLQEYNQKLAEIRARKKTGK